MTNATDDSNINAAIPEPNVTKMPTAIWKGLPESANQLTSCSTVSANPTVWPIKSARIPVKTNVE